MSADQPVILQLLPRLVTGGVERGAVEMTEAIVQAGGVALVASAGGPLVRAIERAGGRHITLPLAAKTPPAIWRNAARLDGTDPRRRRRDRACPLARARLVGLAGLPPHRHAFRHHLSRHLQRDAAVQAPLQRGHGAWASG